MEEAGQTLSTAELKLRGDRTLAICPNCQAKFNVTKVLGDARYDKEPKVPGLQVKCSQCETLFTLPEVTDDESPVDD